MEYNTRNGRKTAYANKQDLIVIGNASSVPDDTSISSNAAMSAPSTVYGGPSTKIYASIGSVSAGEEVEVICREGSFYYIMYYTAASYKRGYVPVSTVTGEENIPERNYSSANAFRMTTAAATVYSAPSSTSAVIGSVFANEGVTCLGLTEGLYTFVEYSTSSGAKRGFVDTSVLTAPVSSVLGKCGADTNVYYVPGQTRIGAVYASEYVCVLSQDAAESVYYIEYNSANGIKRGYAAIGNITLAGGTVSEVSSSVTGHGLKASTVGQDVYSGPSAAYASIGSITQYETVYDLGTESGYTYIQYNISGGYKRGYVPTSTMTAYSEATITENALEFTAISGTQLEVLGESGEGRTINYYMIGDPDATKKMVLNFAIHGHEDAANQIEHDGYELTKLAIKLTQRLGERVEAGDDLNGWLVYVIPALNPDGILYTHPDSEKHVPNTKGYADCGGMGRHSTTEFEWEWDEEDGDSKVIDIEHDTAPVEGGHIDMNRCFLYKDENGVWTFVGYTNAGRNYTGPSPMRAKEALYIHHFLRSIAQEELEKKIFIDTHGWTRQIITSDDNIYEAFNNEFEYNNQTSLHDRGEGYVARYANDLGFRSCLFEFPVMTSDNLGTEHYNFDFIENHGWDEDYITVIENLIDSDNE